MRTQPTPWGTDPNLFAALPGSDAIVGWFGFTPSFHDADLVELTLTKGDAIMRIAAFRMTDQVNEAGYFVLDRHAIVSLHMTKVTGVELNGDAHSILAGLVIRRLEASVPKDRFGTCPGPEAGDYEIAFETSYGLWGALYARGLALSLEPAEVP
ncbi:hypothetical protein [Brevundimonas sp. Root1279]|uniref:hypothetical protein n=1 Tax=Brevundimonas sp. Root1279 TaxID=1736443 RepID=UPI0006FA5403|nr:hypothetical protein [Brevundimonas sp. Root1279]KQW86464.1 hypothetical protein ASC65_00750 [Brevundimonas sp. Root1279]